MAARKERWGKERSSNKREEVWTVDFVMRFPDGNKERIRERSPVNTKRGAEEYERKRRSELLNPASVQPREVPTLTGFKPTFMKLYVVPNNKPSEQISKECIFNTRLLPELGRFRLDRITTEKVEQLKGKWVAEGLSPSRINNILTCIQKTLRYASDDLKRFDGAKLPRIKFLKKPKPDFRFLEREELDQLIEGAGDDAEGKAAVLCASQAGLRMGEVRSLMWPDIDFKREAITVQRTDYRGYEGTPKGGRLRRVPMTFELVQALKAIRHAKPYIFSHTDGKMWSRGDIDTRLRRACRQAHLPQTGWHVLRHTFCSHLAMAGATVRAIQELAGHASITTTQMYMHLSPRAEREAIDLLSRYRHGSSVAAEPDEEKKKKDSSK